MKTRTPARVATAVWMVAVVGLLMQIPFLLVNGVDHGAADYYYTFIMMLFELGVLSIGVLVVRRQPGNRIGWLFLLLGGLGELWAFSQGYATYGLVTSPGSLPFANFAAWVYQWSLGVLLVVFVPIFLLFPDGRTLSPRWRVVLWAWVAGSILVAFAFAFTGHDIQLADPKKGVYVRNMFGLYGSRSLVDAVGSIGGLVVMATAIAACVEIVLRFRRSDDDTRQQIKWLAYVGIAFLASFIASMVVLGVTGTDDVDWAGNLAFAIYSTILLVGLPAACGVAILKYRLYDLDVVVKKTVVFGLLALFISLVYVVVVGGVGAVAGSGGNTVASFAAAAVLAIAFQPVRERARRFADRLVYGKRASPYEVLTEFSGQVAGAYSTEDVLPRMAQILAAGTGADTARVWLHVDGRLRPEAIWPARMLAAGPAPGDAPLTDETVVEVRDRGDLLGALSVHMPANDPMTPARERLVHDLAGQAGLVLRNVRLVEELRASRQRLVAAQDEERRKIERNIHDGAQQLLVALTVQLRLAQQLTDRDPATAKELLAGLQDATGQALEDLRDLARGIYPPLLADKGLATALASQARKAAVPTSVEAEGVGRYARDVEATVYFCTLEALNNVAKYAGASRADVTLRAVDGHLEFRVHDDGAGFDAGATVYGTGLQGMADRLDAVGGALEVDSAPGEGTTVTGRLPVTSYAAPAPPVAAHAASRRSGPNEALGM
jgi:signal transduction histidine kinase